MKIRLLTALAVILAMTGGPLALPAHSASVAKAAISPEWVNAASNKCLDAQDWGRGTDVIQFGCHGGANQRWTIEVPSSGVVILVNAASGKCLDAVESSDDVIQFSCHRGPNQRWRLNATATGTALVNQANGHCLDAIDWGRGENVIHYACHFGANQSWFSRS